MSGERSQMDRLISLQAAIDAADRADYTGLTVEDVKKVTDEVVKELKQLPSAQPEIIYCKDCIRYHEPTCLMAYDGKEWSEDDGFCHVGERRTDDGE